tara:strand:- start:1284 stop:1850 length:567 start_codon:yes stop_codon:yes gene_type:complete
MGKRHIDYEEASHFRKKARLEEKTFNIQTDICKPLAFIFKNYGSDNTVLFDNNNTRVNVDSMYQHLSITLYDILAISYKGPLEIYKFLQQYVIPPYREDEKTNKYTKFKKHVFKFKRTCKLTQEKLELYLRLYDINELDNFGHVRLMSIVNSIRTFIDHNIKLFLDELKRIITIPRQFKLMRDAIAIL